MSSRAQALEIFSIRLYARYCARAETHSRFIFINCSFWTCKNLERERERNLLPIKNVCICDIYWESKRII